MLLAMAFHALIAPVEVIRALMSHDACFQTTLYDRVTLFNDDALPDYAAPYTRTVGERSL